MLTFFDPSLEHNLSDSLDRESLIIQEGSNLVSSFLHILASSAIPFLLYSQELKHSHSVT